MAQLGENERGPIAWMVRHGVAANLVMLSFLIGGFIALMGIKKEVFPEFALDEVSVTVPYPGASPEEVEKSILQVVEEAVRGVEGVDEVTSVAREGLGTVTAEVLVDADMQQVSQDIQSEIDRITTFPEDAEQPEVRIALRRREVMNLLVYGDLPGTVLHELGEQVRDLLIQESDVTQVELTGFPPLEIRIEISQENLRRYGLTLGDVSARLRLASVELPGGGLKTKSGELLVRVKERRDYGKEFAELPIITTADGSQVRLRDIATIDDSFQETDRYALYNGQPAVELEIYRIGRQTPIDVSDAVRRRLDEIKAALPPGVGVAIEQDRSDIYRQRADLLLRNGALGLILVLALLGLFLEFRLAFWVMMGIPISFLGSFLLLPSFGVTINIISLFAFIIALGIVVDDAIVVGENVYHHHQEGMPFGQAAIVGAREMAIPVTFSILTNIAAFLPILFIPGIMGKVHKMTPIVVCIVFIISLIECLFVLPSHLAHQRDRKRRGVALWLHEKQQAFSRRFRHWVVDGYGPFLRGTLEHRYLTVAVALSLLAGSLAYALSGRMGFELFPKVESDYSQAEVVLPFGSPVAKTEAVMDRLLVGARTVIEDGGYAKLVESITTDLGREGGHTGRMRVTLAPPDVRAGVLTTEDFTNEWRAAVGELVGVEFLKFASDAGGPGSHGRPLTIELSHRSIDVLERASKELAETVATYPRVSDVDDGFQPGKPQLDFTIKPEGKSLGLTATLVARQVRGAFYGDEVVRQQRGRNEVKVMVRLPEADRSTEQTVNDLMVRTPAGSFVPLREVATLDRGRAYTTIERRNGRRVVQVSADVTPRGSAGEVIADLRTGTLPELAAKYHGLSFTFEGHQAEIRDSLDSLQVTFTLALLVIYVMLAIPFRSYIQPLVVMLSIPFGIVGAIFGHLVMGYALSIPSVFGMVALSGVVVNDSLILIDFANQHPGLSKLEVIHAAGIQRFRPILLTTLTTFGGLAPMIFETSRQARFLIPMALSLGYGILFATFITLLIVPSMYLIVEDLKGLVSGVTHRLQPGTPGDAQPDGVK